MLVMAALVVGAIWGLAYRLYPQKLGALIVSHAVWDVAVFIFFPDMIIVYKNKVAVMGRIKTRQIDALNYKKASI